MNCQLCGNQIKDSKTAGVVLPWGETCSDCLEDIKEFGTSRI
jgi:hypothetical protein